MGHVVQNWESNRNIIEFSLSFGFIYIYIYIWVEYKLHSVTLSNVTLPNNFLLNSYFENPTIELRVLYVLNMSANFHANRI